MQPMPQGAPAEAPEDAGGDIKSVVMGAHAALMKAGSAIQKAGGSPDALDKLKEAIALFQEAAEDALGGGGEDKAEPKAVGAVSSPEAGGNPNARPMG